MEPIILLLNTSVQFFAGWDFIATKITSAVRYNHNKGKIQPLHNTLQISNLDSNKELARLPNSVAVTNGLRSLTIQILHNTEKKDLDKILSNHIQGYKKKTTKGCLVFPRNIQHKFVVENA